MGLYVLVICAFLIVLLSVIQQWKLLLLLTLLSISTALALLWYSTLEEDGSSVKKEIESIHILYGDEKKGLLKDPKFQEILRKKHNVVINGTKMESLRVPEGNLEGIDALWPSTGWAAATFRQRHPDARYETHNIFSTPIVFYSWPRETDALIRQHAVKKRGTLFIADTKKLLKMGNRTWESIRVPGQEGQVTIRSADPVEDNAGLLTTVLAVVTLHNATNETDMSHLTPEIRKLRKQMGTLGTSADTLFNRYMRQGQGGFPLISGYENQVIEFFHAYPRYQEKIRTLVRVLIPNPTVSSKHPFIALTDKGEMLSKALEDPDVRKLAWQRHGFRSDMTDPDKNSDILKELGLPEQTESLTVPSAMMDNLLERNKF